MIDPDDTPPAAEDDAPAEGRGANEGEGSRSAARDHERRLRRYLADANVAAQAREAARALDGAEGEELRQAETAGRAKADAADVKVRRDR